MKRATLSWNADHEWLGIEMDWVGIDERGHVAVFQTAGFGPVPSDDLVDWETVESSFPPSTEAVLAVETNENWYFAEQLGKRGVFVYDWDATQQSYFLLVAPREASSWPVEGPVAPLLAADFASTLQVVPRAPGAGQ